MVVLSIVMLVSGGVDLDDLGAFLIVGGRYRTICNQCDER